MAPKQLRFIDLFCGLGGFHIGLARLGHRCVFACEKDPDLRELYAANFGIHPHPDIRKLRPSDIPSHDVLCAGFPCQPFSKAGEQLGFRCERDGDLFHHILRIIRARRPQFVILENVANLLRHDGGTTYSLIRTPLERLGYVVSQEVLSPHQFGIPQIRNRLFVVGKRGTLANFHWPTPTARVPNIKSILDDQPSDARPLPDHYTQCIQLWQEFLDRIPSSVALPSFPIWACEFDADYPVDGLPPKKLSSKVLRTFRGAFGEPLDQRSRTDQLRLLPRYALDEHPFPRWKQAFIIQNRSFFAAHRSRLAPWMRKIRDFAPSLQKLEWNCQGESRKLSKHILQFRASGLRVKRSNWAPAIVAMTTTQVPVVTWQRRYMTVRECSRLQGLGQLTFKTLSPGRAYKAIGNAVSADIVELIGRRLLPVRLSCVPAGRRTCSTR
jgi:DNA (cytosine-5)-methyltransferase 1